MNRMAAPSDSQLLAQTRAGDRNAFSMLIDRHKDAMVNYLTRMTGSRDRADELAQETFVRLYTMSPAAAAPDGGLGPWLYRVATNIVRSDERRARRWRVFWFAMAGSGADGGAVNGVVGGAIEQAVEGRQEAELLADETRRQVVAALAALPLRFRTPLVLREIQGLPYEEIALVTGTPLGTVRSRISRGRALLRARLAPLWNGHHR